MAETFWRKQQPAIDQMKINEDEVLIRTQDSKGHYFFTSFSNEDTYCKFLLSGHPKASHSNEVLYTNNHTYFDLDCDQKLSKLGWKSEEQFMESFNGILIKSFEVALHVYIMKRNIHWSSSCKGDKTSYHIVIRTDNYYWSTEQRRAALLDFVNYVISQCPEKGYTFYAKSGDNYQLKNVIDRAVYSKRRHMRTVGCSKYDSTRFLRPLPITEKLTTKIISQHLISIPKSDMDGRDPFRFDDCCKPSTISNNTSEPIMFSLLETLAKKVDSELFETRGNLFILRNASKCRVCVINGESNFSDNSYFFRRKDKLIYCCFNESCMGDELDMHTFETVEHTHYSDYRKVLRANNKEPFTDTKPIDDYLKKAVVFIDDPGNFRLCVTERISIEGFTKPITGIEFKVIPKLFNGKSDIDITINDETEHFSSQLDYMCKRRFLNTFSRVCWTPYAKMSPHHPVILPEIKNTFEGFAIEQVKSKEIKFEKSAIYEMLFRNLCNRREDLFSYLTSLIAHKIMKPFDKVPICLVSISQPGIGKTTFAEFLQRLFCGTRSPLTSYSSTSSFCSNFNAEKQKSLWIVLEECNSRIKNDHNFLKDQISATTLLLERKNENRISVPWYANIIIFSNTTNCIKVEHGDRRLVFLEEDDEQLHTNKKLFFDKVRKELTDANFISAVFKWFAGKYDQEWDYRKIPASDMKDRLQRLCAPPVVHFIEFFYREYDSECGLYYSLDYQRNYRIIIEKDLWAGWEQYVERYGTKSKYDRHYFRQEFENVTKVPLHVLERHQQRGYKITDKCEKRLKDIYKINIKEIHNVRQISLGHKTITQQTLQNAQFGQS